MELLSYSIGSAHEQIARSRRLVAQSEEIIARVKRSLHHSRCIQQAIRETS